MTPQTAQYTADQRLEDAIEATRQALLGAKTRASKVELEREFKKLIGQRSPEQIARLEHERGLAR
jgi:hypothetical protein